MRRSSLSEPQGGSGPLGDGQVAVVAVVDAGQRPAVTFEPGLEVAPRQEILVGEGAAVPGGKCGAAERMEDREASRSPGDTPQLDEAVVGRGEVVHDAGSEDRVADAVGQGEANGIR